MFLLDTNVISELRKQRPHGAVLAWVEAQPRTSLYICAVTVGEIQIGIERTRRQDLAKANDIESWLDDVINTQQFLAIDAETYRLWAKVMTKQPDSVYEDALIAACAKSHGLTVATRNVKHFRLLDVPYFNPFQ